MVDGDGHIVELLPVFIDFAHDHGHGELIDAAKPRLVRGPEQQEARLQLSPDELRRAGSLPDSWHVSANPDYYATCALPRSTTSASTRPGSTSPSSIRRWASTCTQLLDDEQRVTVCRLYNEFMAERYRPYRDRFTVAALIPMTTPAEAIAALEHAKGLGAKVGLIPSHVRRPFLGDEWPPTDPGVALRIPQWEVNGWVDTFGHRQRLRLRPGVGEGHRAADAARRAHRGHRLQRPFVGHQLRVQPDRPLRRVGRGAGEVARASVA